MTQDVLSELGWDSAREAEWAGTGFAQAVLPGRVQRADRGFCVVRTGGGDVHANFANPRTREAGVVEQPVTGDWVAVTDDEYAGPVVVGILERRTVLTRQEAGERVVRQVLAANVDTVLIVSGLDRPVNEARLERLLVMVRNGGAEPVLVLGKADLVDDTAEAVATALSVAGGADVVLVSARTGDGMPDLRAHVGSGRTVALIGESGAGKSTIVNALVGEEVQATSDVRGVDAKGRHTTTTRDLVQLPDGGVLLDTPGLRSVGLWDADEGLSQTFGDIEELAAWCRFSDCAHAGEPGCAVEEAVADGDLDADRLERYRRLQDELASQELRRVEHERRRSERELSRMIKQLHRDRPPKR